MAAIFLRKRVGINISKTSRKHFPNCYHSATRISSTARCLSTAYERAEGISAVAESTSSGTGTEATRDAMYEAKQEALDVDEGRASGMTGFFADKVKDGARKAVDKAENVGDKAKQTKDGAWKAAKETTKKVKEEVIGDDDHIHKVPAVFEVKRTSDPLDTQDYRSIEELGRKANGCHKAAD